MKNKLLLVTLLLFSVIILSGCTKKEDVIVENTDNQEQEVTQTDEDSMPTVNTVEENVTTFTVNKEQSEVKWSAEKIVGAQHYGTIQISDGSVDISDNEFVKGSFVIDMNTITADNEMVQKHLMSDDFFDVEKYATTTIEILSVTKDSSAQESNQYIVSGNLTIKGITNQISFPAIIVEENSVYTATAQITVDRTKWDITYNSGTIFDDLGDKAIKDEFQIDLKLVVENK